MKIKISLTVLSLSLLAAGCATTTRSDSLGLADDESVKTYAAAYQPARDMLNAGRFDELKGRILQDGKTKNGKAMSREEAYEKLIASSSELSIMERGLIALNTGDVERALFFFDAAEEKLNLTEDNHGIGDSATGLAKTAFASVTGASEMSDYEVRSYEKVMLLNYKALCYMLQGDRKAYNVTRRAIDLQQQEWEKFQEMKAKFDEEQEKRAAAAKANAQSGQSNPDAELQQIYDNVNVDNRSADVVKKANLVTSAYVNPFGDYMNALLQEFDSLQDKSLRDNARISYGKVVANNKDCKTAAAAEKAVMKGVSDNQKIVQVILSDGFAPYQVEESRTFAVGKYEATINLAHAAPVETPVVGANVKTGGKTTKMSSLTKMESIILRDEQDHMAWRTMDVALALLRSGLANKKLGAFGGMLAGAVQHPDTRSWLSLPNQVLVSRLVVPASQKTIEISTYGKDGKTIAAKSVALADKGPTVVYAVSYNEHMQAYANAFSWVK